jgi:CheY-like chemotaxis protein
MTKVLMVDDHEPSRRQLVESLTRCGYRIAAEGASGKVALATRLAKLFSSANMID